MNLLTKAESHIPWTRSEILRIGQKTIINRFSGQRFHDFCRKNLYPIGLVNHNVLAGDSMFPNFKEEINVL